MMKETLHLLLATICPDSGGAENHEVGKSLDKKLVVNPTKESNLSKGGRAYDVVDI